MSGLGVPLDADLAWLLEVVWGGLEGVRLSGEPTAVVGAGYRVVPTLRRARAFVPADATAARGALRAGAGTRSRGAQRSRALAARLAGSRLGGAAFRDRFWVIGEDPLCAAVMSAIGEGPVSFAAAVRPPSPFRKPVLQAVTPEGRVVGYAKVAWNAVTAANVRAEHVALQRLETAEAAAPRGPAPLALLEHRGFPVLLTRPMPEQLRRYDAQAGPPGAPVSRAVAGLAPVDAGRDPVGARLRARFDATHAPSQPRVMVALADLLGGIGARTADLPSGVWHGDWSPWNLGWVGERLWAWDWEYSRADVPVGLDLPHFIFQMRFIGQRAPVQVAFADARSQSAAALSSLGYDAADRTVLHAAHAAEVSLRYLEAEAAGVAANARFLAGAVTALRSASDALR
ncbi:MAG: hypothetical protein ABJB55_05010 [Actinomycetota bacterium]